MLSKILGSHPGCFIDSLFCTNTPGEMRRKLRFMCDSPPAPRLESPLIVGVGSAGSPTGAERRPRPGLGRLPGYCAWLIIRWWPAPATGSGCLVLHVCLRAKKLILFWLPNFLVMAFSFFKTHFDYSLWSSLYDNKETLIISKGPIALHLRPSKETLPQLEK